MISRCVPRAHSASYIICSIIGQMTWTSTVFFCVWEWGESLWVTVPTATTASNPQRAHRPSGQGTNSTGPYITLHVSWSAPHHHQPRRKSSRRQLGLVGMQRCPLQIVFELIAALASFHPSLFLILRVRLLSCAPVFSPRRQCTWEDGLLSAMQNLCWKLKIQPAGMLCAKTQKGIRLKDLCVCSTLLKCSFLRVS